MGGQKDVHIHGRMREELTSYWNRAISIPRASPGRYSNTCCIASCMREYERDVEARTHDAAIRIVIALVGIVILS